ncbi:MAG: NapC/NirT family cytochrome c [Clostridia bacterium]|nr:NapC/NirT family cytochrome c [Clostridia bacterium]
MSTRKLQAIILVVLVVAIGGAVAASRREQASESCGSCHSMAPYAQSWKESNHKNVECWDCHTGPGVGGWVRGMLNIARMKRVEKSGATPDLKVEADESFCLRCHPKAKSISETETMKIPHTLHEGVGLDCQACHGGQVHGENGSAPVSISHDTCIGCHAEWIENDDECVKCHKW